MRMAIEDRWGGAPCATDEAIAVCPAVAETRTWAYLLVLQARSRNSD